jgi:hypothetical protein
MDGSDCFGSRSQSITAVSLVMVSLLVERVVEGSGPNAGLMDPVE